MSLITHFTFLYFNVICLFEAVKYVVVGCQVKIKTNLSLDILIFKIFPTKNIQCEEQTGMIFSRRKGDRERLLYQAFLLHKVRDPQLRSEEREVLLLQSDSV